MKIIRVNLKNNPYNIIVGRGIINAFGRHIAGLNIGNDAYIITNASVKNMHGEKLAGALKKRGFSVRFKLVPDTERSKSLSTAWEVLKDLSRYAKKRRIFVVAFGGGVVGDLAGFVASIYKRGVPYVQVPTTLLAQVDSSIGGKTAVDLPEGKNLAGTFYQPCLVFTDTALLKTLPLRQMQNGMAEIIKYAVIKDAGLFKYLEHGYPDALSYNEHALNFIVSRCASIKAKIVAEDEKETKGIRTILNFGHTIGHAIEAAGGYGLYSHGQAIALGMLVAGNISNKLGLVSEEDFSRIESLIKKSGLPERIRKISVGAIIKAYYHDKKFIGPRNRFVLINGIGRATIRQNLPLALIRGILKKRI
jgi:3-dehydroquinate synthase